jgi:hypothetical protein
MHIKFDISAGIFLPAIVAAPIKSDGKIATRAQRRQKRGKEPHSRHSSRAKLP